MDQRLTLSFIYSHPLGFQGSVVIKSAKEYHQLEEAVHKIFTYFIELYHFPTSYYGNGEIAQLQY